MKPPRRLGRSFSPAALLLAVLGLLTAGAWWALQGPYAQKGPAGSLSGSGGAAQFGCLSGKRDPRAAMKKGEGRMERKSVEWTADVEMSALAGSYAKRLEYPGDDRASITLADGSVLECRSSWSAEFPSPISLTSTDLETGESVVFKGFCHWQPA